MSRFVQGCLEIRYRLKKKSAEINESLRQKCSDPLFFYFYFRPTFYLGRPFLVRLKKVRLFKADLF